MQRRQIMGWSGRVFGLLVLASASAAARGQSAPTGEIVSSSGVISPIVADYDRSLQFYHGLLGLEAPAPRIASAKDSPPPPLLTLQGTPDGRMRWSHVTFPGTQWWAEPLEYTEVERQAVQPRLQDPGAATIIFRVRDVDTMSARLQQAGTPIVTPGGKPVMVDIGASKGRALLVKDPDGHFVELVQPSAIAPDAPPTDVIGAGVRLTIADTDKTVHLYRDQLGFQPSVGGFTKNGGYAALTGLSGAELRLTMAPVPGEPRLAFEFVEFRGVDRRQVRARIQDPGSMKFQFVVRSLDAAAAKFVAAGGSVVSTGGKPIILGGAGPHLIVRDPNNFYLILQQQPPKKP
jgi:catechol 2,3-dioxygenase-like lactoylglutathione lyase family enzyme